MRYLAKFQPEAWINDYAVPVSDPPPCEWDATAFLLDGDHYCGRLAEAVAIHGETADVRDALHADPKAPPLVREWRGPFTITVRQEG